MSEIYEVVIFTAAMQDVLLILMNHLFSMLIGYLIKLTRRSISVIVCTVSMPFLMDLSS
jgi:hypothetical protein